MINEGHDSVQGLGVAEGVVVPRLEILREDRVAPAHHRDGRVEAPQGELKVERVRDVR